MTYHRTPYEDAETPHEMCDDCQQVGHNMHLHEREADVRTGEYLGGAAAPPAAHPHSRVEVSEELARMAGGLELHFD